MRLVAKISSIVFQPIMMPTVCLILIFQLNDFLYASHSQELRYAIYLKIFLFTVVSIVAMGLILLKLGWVSDIHLTKRKERVGPFIVVIGLFITFYYLVRSNPEYDSLVYAVLFGNIVTLLIANAITMFWKISIHSLGVSCTFGTFAAVAIQTGSDMGMVSFALFLIVILVGISRVVLEKHTIMQVVWGTSLGVFGPASAILFDLYI